MCLGSVKTPSAPLPTAPAATASNVASSDSVKLARDNERKRMAAAMSQASLNKTGGQGVTTTATVNKKKLLGE